jgi:prepilin-type N-terminal cleavage/methylation domain-containing protein
MDAERTTARQAVQAGFTLLEVVTALLVMAVTMPLFHSLLHVALQADRLGSVQALESYEARNVTERILKDLREANRIVSVAGDALQLENQGGDLIRYERSGGVVYRTYHTAKVPLSEHVSQLQFAESGGLLIITAGGERAGVRVIGGSRL